MSVSKRRWSRVLAICLAVAMVVLPMQWVAGNVLAAEKPLVYVSLGDAVAQGVGGEMSASGLVGYDDYLLAKLQSKNKNVSFELRNVASRLDTSSDILAKLSGDTPVTKALQGADLVTVNIGANNLILPVWPIMTNIFTGQISPYEGYMQIFAAAPAIQANVDQFKADLPKIVRRIHELAPNAQIFFNTMYNPFMLPDPLYQYGEYFIGQINAAIKDKALVNITGVADVHEAFAAAELAAYNSGYVNYQPMVHQFPSPDIVHPTPLGYQTMANLFNVGFISQ